MAPTCAHLAQIKIVARPSRIPGCDGCLANGTEWVHLRMCHSCGYIGCCDDSPGKHARRHAEASEHPLMRSVEPREGWSYCFVDDVTFQIGPA